MIKVKHAKKLSVLILVVALVMTATGWLEQEIYSWPQSKSVCLNSETFDLASNATAYRIIPLNQSGENYVYVHLPIDTGTVFSATLTDECLHKWLSGNYNVSWDGTRNSAGGTTKSYYFEVQENSPIVANIVLWNPEGFTQQVDLSVSHLWREMDYANYNLSLALLIAGVVLLFSVTVVWAIKNRGTMQVSKLSNKKLAMLAISIILLASGLWAANTFSSPVEAQETTAKGAVPLSPYSQQCISFQQTQSGTYFFQIDASVGSVLVYSGGENSTVDYYSNGTAFPKRPDFNGTSGQFAWGMFGDSSQSVTHYLTFLNPDGISKEVTYEVSRHWTYSNYIGLTAGIASAAAGALMFGLTLLKDKLKNFNRALDNQI
jgi:hypothetical protein